MFHIMTENMAQYDVNIYHEKSEGSGVDLRAFSAQSSSFYSELPDLDIDYFQYQFDYTDDFFKKLKSDQKPEIENCSTGNCLCRVIEQNQLKFPFETEICYTDDHGLRVRFL